MNCNRMIFVSLSYERTQFFVNSVSQLHENRSIECILNDYTEKMIDTIEK